MPGGDSTVRAIELFCGIGGFAAANCRAISSCFTAAYGRSHVRSGSYLAMDDRFRRFAPREILRLLGYPDSFVWPEHLSLRQSWRLLGNSVSLRAVAHVLRAIPVDVC
ncbi:MAG: DNA cytosine methyltransferase [Planctomycetales bacterium]|nr:DNA cytosine methyltransferase [Planctomycetales bacterium]